MSSSSHPTSNDHLFARHLITELQEALGAAKVVNVIGPRQVGKTTMVKTLFKGGRYITLDERKTLEALTSDPVTQLTILLQDLHEGPLIVDEVQRLKSLALDIKLIVDNDRRHGRFLLTGSSNVFSTLDATDSLAGRMLTLKLWPLSLAELERRGPNHLLDWAAQTAPDLTNAPEAPIYQRSHYIDLILRGGYPEIRLLNSRLRGNRYRDYVDAVVDRDVSDLLKVRKSDALRRLIDQLAARTSFELNMSELSSLIGVQRQTLDQYVDVLTRLSVVTRQPAWSASESKRDIRNSKMHFVDTGVVSALRGLTSDSFNLNADPTALGGLLETWVFNELLRSVQHQKIHFRLYHWRDRNKREIDILISHSAGLIAIEVKAASEVSNRDFKNLRWFAHEGPGKGKRVTQIVIYLGDAKLSFGDRAFALPASVLCGDAITNIGIESN